MSNKQKQITENILWQNGPHRVVKNDDGTVSAWMDCNQIDWSQPNQLALVATGRNQYASFGVVAEMPRGEKFTGIVEVIFRKYGCPLSDQGLAEKTAKHGSLISPFFQTKINKIFSKLADEHPNGTYWQDASGKWCYIAFNYWDGERYVEVDQNNNDWIGNWWFGVLPK